MKRLNTSIYIILAIVLVMLNGFLSQVDIRWDLTTDKRFTVSDRASEIVRGSGDDLVITVLLEGNIPADLRAYREYIDIYLWQLRKRNRRITIIYKNPNEGTIDEVNSLRTFLRSRGITPISQRVSSQEEVTESLIYPYISVHNSRAIAFIDLLSTSSMNIQAESAVVAAIAQFESRLVRAIRDISIEGARNIVVMGNKAERLAGQLPAEIDELKPYRFHLPGGVSMDSVDVVMVVASPGALSRDDLVFVDQCVLRDIPIAWFLDRYEVTIDSIRKYGTYVAIAEPGPADDMLFKWGVRQSTDLMMDLSCSTIPQVVGQAGGQPRIISVGYPFHPVLQDLTALFVNEPVSTFFISPLDTLRTATHIVKTPMIYASPYTRTRPSPVNLDFNFLRVQPDPLDYEEGPLLTGVMIEGIFPSFFEGRMMADDRAYLDRLGTAVMTGQGQTRQIIIADTDFLISPTDKDGRIMPVGYNPWERQSFNGNGKLIANIIEKLVYGDDVLTLYRSGLSIIPIDLNRYTSHRFRYLGIMTGIPLAILCILFSIFRLAMGYRYGRKHVQS